jgi:selenide,water dikinase
LDRLPRAVHAQLLVGFEGNADAGVFRLGAHEALVQSVDFITPLVDDPRDFGMIAAANALSDLYAVNARPITALALVGFPDKELGADVLVEILAGGASKVEEAGAVVLGGHSVRDAELKYGLAVTGLVDPAAMRTNRTARPGDQLVLTKPLGTGFIANALKGGQIEERDSSVREAVASMQTLNAAASEVFARHGVRAATDVTGFGLLGHALSMAKASGVGLRVRLRSLPIFPLALKLAEHSLGGGGRANREAVAPYFEPGHAPSEPHLRVACDAQTSGGLLGAVPVDRVEAVVHDLVAAGCPAATPLADVVADHPGRIALLD